MSTLIKVFIISFFLDGGNHECIRDITIARYKNCTNKSSYLKIPNEYDKLSKVYNIDTASIIDAQLYQKKQLGQKVDTAISNFFCLQPIINNWEYYSKKAVNVSDKEYQKYVNEKKINMEFFYLGDIKYSSRFTTKLFFLKDTSDSEGILLKIIAVNSIRKTIESIIILSTYSYFLGMTDHIIAEYREKEFLLETHEPSDVIISKEGLKELSKREKRAIEYGYCIHLIFDSKGAIKIVR